MANKIQIKRTSVSGRTPNTTNVSNTQYIDSGELALNIADKKLFSSNGSASFEVGSNLNVLSVNTITANGSNGTAGQVLTSNGSTVYWDTSAAGITVRSTAGNGGAINTAVSSVTAINFDTLTGFNVTDQGSGNVFVSLGSGFKTIEVAGQTSITAVGEDTLVIANGENIILTTSNVAPKTLTINLSSNIVTNSQLSGNLANYVTATNLTNNLANYQTTAGLSSNVATLTANNTSFVGTVSAANVVSNAQLSGNLTNYQTTAGLAANVATLAANSATYLNNANNIGNSTGIFVGSDTAVGRAEIRPTQIRVTNNDVDTIANTAGLFTSGKVNATSFTIGTSLIVNSSAINIGSQTARISWPSGGTYGPPQFTTYSDGARLVLYNNISGIYAGYALGIDADTLWYGTDRTASSHKWYAGNTLHLTSNTEGLFVNNLVNATAFNIGSSFTANSTRVVLSTSTGLQANGSLGSSGQVLTSNGTTVYWSTPSAAAVNTDAQYTWANVQTFANTVVINNAQQFKFQTVNTAAYAYFTQQNDDNFVFYSTNTAYGARPIWGIYANSVTSNLQVYVPLQLNSGLVANGALGTAGQVLTSNGSATYWSAVGGSGTVTSVASGNGLSGGPITTTGTLSVVANNGITVNSTGVFVTQGTGTVVNTTGVHVNSAYIATLSANDAAYLGGVAAADYQTEAGLAANVATLTANNTNFVGTVSAANVVSNAQLSSNLANYQTTAGLAANVATLAANSATYLGAAGNLGNSSGIFTTGTVNAATVSLGSAFVANSSQLTITTPLSANGGVGSSGQVLTSNGATGAPYWSTVTTGGGFTNGQSISVNNFVITGAFTANSSNGNSGDVLVSNGTGVYWAAPSAASVNTAAQFNWTNTHSFSANVTLAGVIANGSIGTSGQALLSNGSATYWGSPSAAFDYGMVLALPSVSF